MGDISTSSDRIPLILGEVMIQSLSARAVEVVSEAEFRTEGFIGDEYLACASSDSVICLDEEDSNNLPGLPMQLESVNPVGNINNLNGIADDEDFSIIYEKYSPSPDIQVVMRCSSSISKKKGNRNAQRQFRIRENNGNAAVNNEYREILSTSNTNSLNDSVCIIDDNPSVTTSNSPSKRPLNETVEINQQTLPNSVEKKKRKIECGVCFDGPDEITSNGRNVVSTVCGHIFCSQCVQMAIKCSKQCPQCRKKLTLKQYHPIYI